MTSPYVAITERPATLLDLRIFRITGALLMHEAMMMAMPMPLAMRRVMQGVLSMGSDSRQVVGVTRGDGSDSHAHLARERINGLSVKAPMMVCRC